MSVGEGEEWRWQLSPIGKCYWWVYKACLPFLCPGLVHAEGLTRTRVESLAGLVLHWYETMHGRPTFPGSPSRAVCRPHPVPALPVEKCENDTRVVLSPGLLYLPVPWLQSWGCSRSIPAGPPAGQECPPPRAPCRRRVEVGSLNSNSQGHPRQTPACWGASDHWL